MNIFLLFLIHLVFYFYQLYFLPNKLIFYEDSQYFWLFILIILEKKYDIFDDLFLPCESC